MRLKKFTLNLGTQMFKSFSDESRVRIMNLLVNKGEMCISDLELILDFTQTKTSRHIAYLKNAGIVTLRKVDQWMFYSVKEEVLDLISRNLEFLDKDPNLMKDLENYETLYSNRELAVNKLPARKFQSQY